MLDDAVERFDHAPDGARDRFADGGAEDGVDRVDDDGRIAADGLLKTGFDERAQGDGEPRVAARRASDGVGEDARRLFGANVGVVEAALELGELLLLGGEQKPLKLPQILVGIARGRAGMRRGPLGLSRAFRNRRLKGSMHFQLGRHFPQQFG